MPILTLPLGPDGTIVDVLVGPSHARSQVLGNLGQPVPVAVQIRALILQRYIS